MRIKQQESFWRSRPVLVTGCTGILGSWLTIALVERGAEVVGLIRDLVPKSNLNWSGFQQRITVVRGDVTDFNTIERALNEYEIDTCFHLAAQTIVTIANRSPLSTFESNIRGTWTVLEAARQSKTLKRLVLASTDKVYGDQEKLPYVESQPLQGIYSYDISKVCADLLAQSYYSTFELPVAITRCGNLYGGGDLNFNRIVPGTIRSVIFDESPIIRSDGTPVRDYFYVEDAVEAYIHLAENMDRDEIKGEAFNFSSGTPISVLNLVEKIIEISEKRNIKPIILAEKTEKEIKNQFLSCEKAEQRLNWRSAYSLDEGLAKTYKWYEEFFWSQENERTEE